MEEITFELWFQRETADRLDQVLLGAPSVSCLQGLEPRVGHCTQHGWKQTPRSTLSTGEKKRGMWTWGRHTLIRNAARSAQSINQSIINQPTVIIHHFLMTDQRHQHVIKIKGQINVKLQHPLQLTSFSWMISPCTP